MRDTQKERQIHRQREKQASCRKPNVGLYPGTLGSCPGPKADAQPLRYPGVPSSLNSLMLATNFKQFKTPHERYSPVFNF